MAGAFGRYTLHVYAPGLRRMKIFNQQTSEVSVIAATVTEHVEWETKAVPVHWKSEAGVDLCDAIDVSSWNEEQRGIKRSASRADMDAADEHLKP